MIPGTRSLAYSIIVCNLTKNDLKKVKKISCALVGSLMCVDFVVKSRFFVALECVCIKDSKTEPKFSCVMEIQHMPCSPKNCM